ncbi:MAG: 4-(cytidine 5'-diphospho)-2-C-methyl-D-erythritol kinase [Bacteroidales bacterium]|nr:4-(cytidine 5'-diphospho)-2-C-methyl-D-erythritol kinase [Bacteroidales bacterium]
MLLFPNAKINLGLSITEKRPDGFHNLLTVFYPIGLCDMLEFIEDPKVQKGRINLNITGIKVDGDPMENLCAKAYNLLQSDFNLPGLSVHLHKIIPIGAGLGGGSSDAAFMLKGLNSHFNLSLSTEELEEYAARLGSDCAFFIRNQPVFAYEKGNVFRDLKLILDDFYIMLIHPGIHISTSIAYAQIVPSLPVKSPEKIVLLPVERWKDELQNDFEKSLFGKYPEIRTIKERLYKMGALYACMSGSGSSVFGIFSEMPSVPEDFSSYFHWKGKLQAKMEGNQ